MSTVDQDSFNNDRAELFEALGHPTRIMILQALTDSLLGFSALKRKTGIESNGLLSFHLNKLGNLVKTTPQNDYTLTDEGREALRILAFKDSHDSINKRNRYIPTSYKALAIVLIIALSTLAVYSEVSSLQNQISSLQASNTELENQVSSLIAHENLSYQRTVLNTTASHQPNSGNESWNFTGFQYTGYLNISINPSTILYSNLTSTASTGYVDVIYSYQNKPIVIKFDFDLYIDSSINIPILPTQNLQVIIGNRLPTITLPPYVFGVYIVNVLIVTITYHY